MTRFFTAWQRRSIGGALTFLSLVAMGVTAIWLLSQFARAVAFLQPALIPFAVGAVLAFLLDPVVRLICARTRMSRLKAVSLLLGTIVLTLVGLGVWLVPVAYRSTTRMVHDIPAFMQKAEQRLFGALSASQKQLDHFSGMPTNPNPPSKAPEASPSPAASPENAQNPGASPASSAARNSPPAVSPAPDEEKKAPDAGSNPKQSDSSGMPTVDVNHNGRVDADDLREVISQQMPKLRQQAPALLQRAGEILLKGVGGVLGSVGVLLDLIIIPIYVFFLLVEWRTIAKRWPDYLPLRDSPFKQEVASTLVEIHGYLVAFFRGQLVVSSIDGLLIGAGLWLIVGLNFSVFIGLLVVVLTFIPYIGIMLCYVPAVLIAIVQFGDWQHPLYVVAIMFGVQTLESTVIAPKIVGESTGLHPLTVIISVFVWGLVLDGPIGAILAVPLTAALKVVMRRYVWERARVSARILPTSDVQPVLRAGDRDRFGDGEPDVKAVPEVVAHPKEAPLAPEGAASVNPPTGRND